MAVVPVPLRLRGAQRPQRTLHALPPSDEEHREHYRRANEMRDKTHALLRRVLDLDAGAQLDLFDQLI